MIMIAIISSECAASVEGEIFYRYKNASSDVCSMEEPSHALSNVRSKQECVLLCQADPRCSGVNWKESSVCEIYSFKPNTFGQAPSCSYFSPGEHSNLTIYFIILTCVFSKSHVHEGHSGVIFDPKIKLLTSVS